MYKTCLVSQYKKDLRICDNIQKIASGQGYNYTTGCLLDYLYFKTFYKMIVIDLSKQKALANKLFLLDV